MSNLLKAFFRGWSLAGIFGNNESSFDMYGTLRVYKDPNLAPEEKDAYAISKDWEAIYGDLNSAWRITQNGGKKWLPSIIDTKAL